MSDQEKMINDFAEAMASYADARAYVLEQDEVAFEAFEEETLCV
jgi:hypothetical protein